MEDEEILTLLWNREEQGLKELGQKYGKRIEQLAEKFLSAEDAKSEKNCCTMTVKTEIAEMTGSETNVYFELGKKRCIARIKAEEKISNGDFVKLAFCNSSVYFFDKSTTQAIG